MFQIFQFGNPSAGTNSALLSSSDTPSGIVRACMAQLLAHTQKKDKELLDSIQVWACLFDFHVFFVVASDRVTSRGAK